MNTTSWQQRNDNDLAERLAALRRRLAQRAALLSSTAPLPEAALQELPDPNLDRPVSDISDSKSPTDGIQGSDDNLTTPPRRDPTQNLAPPAIELLRLRLGLS